MTSELQTNLAHQIRDAYRDATQLAEQSKGYASQAVAKAIECGQLLIRQKESLGHGSWMEWTATNLPDIHHDTLGRYMRVAKTAQVTLPSGENEGDSNSTRVSNLENAASLRQAFVAVGILPPPEDKSKQTPDPNKPWVKFIRFLRGFRLWYNKRIEEKPLHAWDEDSRRLLKNELRWFADLYERL